MTRRGLDATERRSLSFILAYYAVGVAAAAALVTLVPGLDNAFALGRLRELSEAGLGTGTSPGGPALAAWDRYGVGAAAASAFGALVVMIPVAWTYILIRRNADYDQSLVHTLLILPVAVAGIVTIVQNSLALAFSLAGIVAAVRFRTTLEDTKDAVYVFLAIGVGLAAGVHALGIAAVLSAAFNGINIVLWRLNFGNIYADQRRRTRGFGLGDAIAGPGSGASALSFGDSRLVEAMEPRQLEEVAERLARMDRYLDDEAEGGKERKQFHVLLVHAKTVDRAQSVTESALATMAARWRLAEIGRGSGDTSVLEYLVRLKDGFSAGTLLDTIRTESGTAVQAAEIRSLHGQKRRS
ncbi:MAG: DUF4956 domain-containing protein [Longimicrobiales bacterium]